MKKTKATEHRCGLCGKTGRLWQTECCGNWICDDEHKYKLFSFARNSCSRNHRRYTLCALHFDEGHDGNWKDCSKCREKLETEMYVWYGTNEYNFEKLPNPPSFTPTRCAQCGVVIKLGTGGYAWKGGKYECQTCSEKELAKLLGDATRSRGRGKGRGGRA